MMYMYDSDYVMRKRCNWLTIIKVVLVLAALAFVAYKIYDKFFKKIKPVAAPVDEDEILGEVAEEEAFEASAQDVIATAAE